MVVCNGFSGVEGRWTLPAGWKWTLTRIVHYLPEVDIDGWRVLLSREGCASIEAIHPNLLYACGLAMEAAAGLYPATFPAPAPKGK